MANHTTTIEAPAFSRAYKMSASSSPWQGNARNGDTVPDIELRNASDSLTLGSSAVAQAVPHWNSPSINKYRTLATFWSFLIVGMNDGSYGVSDRFEPDGL
jgi:hypothetical protein